MHLDPTGLKVSLRPNMSLRHMLVRPKDHTAESEKTGVDRVPGTMCKLTATYGRQTGRRLDQRLSDHRHASKSGDCANLALAEHAWGGHHPVDWCNTNVLDHY